MERVGGAREEKRRLLLSQEGLRDRGGEVNVGQTSPRRDDGRTFVAAGEDDWPVAEHGDADAGESFPP